MAGSVTGIFDGPTVPNQVAPVLQKEDGSFVGAVLDGDPDNPETDMVAFGAGGDVRWIVPNDQPQIALAGGGVIGQSGIKYDGAGNATSQIGSPGGIPNWAGQLYSPASSGVQLNYFWTNIAAGFWSAAGANPSGNATSIGNLGLIEGLPMWLFAATPRCQLGSTKAALGGAPLAQYTGLKTQVLSILGALTPTSACYQFFSGNYLNLTPGATLATFMGSLSAAITNQVPYDGVLSNISLVAAGFWFESDTLSPIWPKWPTYPVCGKFVNPNGSWSGTVAAAQVQPPATDVYIGTQTNALKYLTQSTVLHETLHNLTVRSDKDLYKALTGKTLPDGAPTSLINDALVKNGCAVN